MWPLQNQLSSCATLDCPQDFHFIAVAMAGGGGSADAESGSPVGSTPATPRTPSGNVSEDEREIPDWLQGAAKYVVHVTKMNSDSCKSITFNYQHAQDDVSMGWLMNMTKEIFDAEVDYGKHDISLVTKSAKVFLSSAHPNAAYISVRQVLFHCEDEMVQGELSLTAVLSKKM